MRVWKTDAVGPTGSTHPQCVYRKWNRNHRCEIWVWDHPEIAARLVRMLNAWERRRQKVVDRPEQVTHLAPAMKKTYYSVLLAIGLASGLFIGCKSTLAPGPYGGGIILVTNTTGVVTNTIAADMGLYVADGSFVSAVSALDLAFRFERDNRATLWKISPEIKHGLDLIRPGAEQGVQAYRAARAAYLKNPTPAGLDLLTTILGKVQQAANAATAAVTSVTTKPTK